MKPPILIAVALGLCAAGCGRVADMDEPKVEVYSQFVAGDDYYRTLVELELADKEVRYRSGLPPGQMTAIYFEDDGNVHLDAKKVGERLVLRSSPYFEYTTGTVEERLAAWDSGADPQNGSLKREH